MRRFWADSSCFQKEEVILKGPLFHHVCRVSQIKQGEPFELFAEGQKKYTVALDSIGHAQARAKILKTEQVLPLQKPHLHLALSMPRFSKLDFIVEKCIELGVKEFHPFISSLSFITKSSQFSQAKEKRLKKIIHKASAVTGRTEELKIHPVCHLKDISIPKQDFAFMAYEAGEIPTLKSILKKSNPSPEEVWLFIGSEGGFTPEEAQSFSQSGVQVVSLGDQILRVETACLMGLSILKYHYHHKS